MYTSLFSSKTMFCFLALDSPDSESARSFKRNLRICIMRHMGHQKFVEQLNKYLKRSGYTNVTVCTGSTSIDTGIYYDEFEVWILLPPVLQTCSDNSRNNLTEYSNHVGSLKYNIANCRHSANKKVIIHSYLYKSETCTEDYQRALEDQEEHKKLMIKYIHELTEDSLGASLSEGM